MLRADPWRRTTRQRRADAQAVMRQLVAIRRRHRITQETVADRLATTRDVVSRWETCARQPRLGDLLGYVHAIGARITIVETPARPA
ncbi:helix-turn-helix domain-containing protein [Prauserella endophytica]|uniref:Helix-turn-helix transcriptional regulator n=1 Tax=Prauserella endophytica TaxID=1592324 RepID=A0ABY2RZU8_9PSEU|nr:helix-turn-helix transcriptional regulator [Prauserella endophytica]PXY20302.1 hypothetical protein BAY59_31170 [Prauserella coralliicola]TKG66904.1 helix-turn-helix transcriptional regulator [Prauserella endophytica]